MGIKILKQPSVNNPIMSKSVSKKSKHSRLKSQDTPKLAEYLNSVELKIQEANESENEHEQVQSEVQKPENNGYPEVPGFKILEVVGSGGMGSVYKAQNIETEEIHAVKVLKDDLMGDAASIKRFNQEAEAASKLSHENLVNILGHGTTSDGIPFLVMDYIKGKSLRTIIQEENNLSQEIAVPILKQICKGFSYAHENGVIHKDIKPSNIIIEDRIDGSKQAKLLDFGIAQVSSKGGRETQELTKTGDVLGSPQYMSPEQCLGFLLDERSDIYSFGCLMYETLTGKPPFETNNPVQLVVSHMNEKAPGFKREFKAGKVMRNLENVTLRCLNKDQVDRYQTAEEIYQDLVQVEEGKTIAQFANYEKHNAKIKTDKVISVMTIIGLVGIGIELFAFEYLEYKPMALAINILCSIAVFSLATIQIPKECIKLNHFREKRGTIRQWSKSLFFLNLSISGFFLAFSFLTMGYQLYSAQPIWFAQVDFCFYIGLCIFVALSIGSVLSYTVAPFSKKVTAVIPILLTAVMPVLLVSLSFVCVPKQLTNFVRSISFKADRPFPEISLALKDFSINYLPYDQREINSKVSLLERLGRRDEAIKTIKIVENADNELFMLQRRAYLYFRNGQYDKAFKDAETFENKSKDNKTFFSSLDPLQARILAIRGEDQKAMSIFNQSIKESPSYRNISYKRRIGLLVKRGDLEQAIKEQTKLCKYGSNQFCEYISRALLYEQQGDIEKAMKDYQWIVDKGAKSDKEEKKKGIYYSRSNYYYNSNYQYNLYRAYAAMKVGDKAQYKEFLDKAKKAYKKNFDKDLISNLDLKESGIELNFPSF